MFDKEDDDGRYVNDDNLSDIKEDLVDEAREDQTKTGSDGGKSDSDDKGKQSSAVNSYSHHHQPCTIKIERFERLLGLAILVFSRAREL